METWYQHSLYWLYKTFPTHAWAIEILFTIIAIVSLQAVLWRVARRVSHARQASAKVWDGALIASFPRPGVTLIGLFGVTIILQVLTHHYTLNTIRYLPNLLRQLSFVLVLGWFLAVFIREARDRFLTRAMEQSKAIDKTLVLALTQLAWISVVILITGWILQILGISLATLIAFGGIGGAAVAFASKDLLANFFGGLALYLDRPFKVGDLIRSPDRNIEGIVEYIGWRSIRINNPENRPLYIPNNVFSTISIENISRISNRRLQTQLTIRYEDVNKISIILQEITRLLQLHPLYDPSQLMNVNLIEFGNYSLNIEISVFLKIVDKNHFQNVRQEIYFEILNIIKKNAAQLAFPTQVVQVNTSSLN